MNGNLRFMKMDGQLHYSYLQSLKFMNIAAFITVVSVNMLAQTLPLAGHTTAQVSAMYPTLLTPAGITFSIWFLIYALLGVFVIQQAIAKDDFATKEIGWLFTIGCGLNVLWVISWHYELMLIATAAIVGLWISLFMISAKIDREHWAMKAIFNIYYAWISLATAAQVYVYMSKLFPLIGKNEIAVAITVVLMLALAGFAFVRIYKEHDLFFGLTIAWGLSGIFIKHVVELDMLYPVIAITSAVLIVGILAVIITGIMHADDKKVIMQN